MAIYPGALYRPVAWAESRDDSTPANMVVLHVTDSFADSQYGYFNTSRKACSNFHIALDGEVEQYINTSFISASEFEASNDAISVETAGRGDGVWTPEQVVALTNLLRWIHVMHGIPLRLKESSRPDEAGIGWHRLGINGNFPLNPPILRGMNQRPGLGEESWSTAFGKVCPGDDRILQIPELVEAAARGLDPDFGFVDNPIIITPQVPGGLLRDGWFGPKTARVLQREMGTHVDGVVSEQYALTPTRTKYLTAFQWVTADVDGSRVIAAAQRLLGVRDDGVLGPKTAAAWQRRLGVADDGVFGPKTVRALQGALNDGGIW